VLGSLETSSSSATSSDDTTKQYHERKSAKGLDEDEKYDSEKIDTTTTTTSTSSEDEKDDENERFIKILSEDLNFPSGGIKIIKAPDLSKDNEGKKITDTLAMMLENQDKWIKKIEEELDDLNKVEEESVEEVPVKEKTADEIEGGFENLIKNNIIFIVMKLQQIL
jgi:hypothetical protein